MNERARVRRASGQKYSEGRIVSLYSKGGFKYAFAIGSPKPVPETLSLAPTHWPETVGFLRNLRDGLSSLINMPLRRPVARTERIGPYWDFSKIKSLSLQAALLVASEYDRLRRLRGIVPRAVDIHEWDPQIVNTLDAIGFFELTGVEAKADPTIPIIGGKLLRMRRGSSADGEQVGEYLNQLGLDLTEEDPSLSDALMEAVTNCVQHAYARENLCEPRTPHLWWIVASLKHLDDGRRLRIAISDHGASIPATLPFWEKYPLLIKLWEQNKVQDGAEPNRDDERYDGTSIALAVQIGQTSTREHNRGKGIDQIVRALDLSKRGIVTIYSRAGAVRHSKGGNAQTFNHRIGMVGTLVMWDLVI